MAGGFERRIFSLRCLKGGERGKWDNRANYGFRNPAAYYTTMAKRNPGPSSKKRPATQSLAAFTGNPVTLTPPQAIQQAIVAYNLGDWTKAEQLCRLVLSAQAAYFDALNLLGIIAAQTLRMEEAADFFGRAVAAKPHNVEAHNNLGNARKELKRFDDALESYERALKIDPGHAGAYNNRGLTLHELRRFDDALESFERALKNKPDYAAAYCNRGNTLLELKRFDDALECYERALKIKPDYAAAYYNRGNTLLDLSRFDDALESYELALKIKPDYAEAYNNRGNTLKVLKRIDDALNSYEHALKIKSRYVDAHCNLSFCRLLKGDYARGWEGHEWRWEVGPLEKRQRRFTQPLWLGKESLQDKTILLHSEQGLGDTIQFCRYAQLVADLGARVVLEVPGSLVSLLTTLEGVSQLVAEGSALPAFDYQCPLMSLPLALKTELSSIPARNAYLKSNRAKRLDWSEKLGEKKELRVGLVWSGGFRPNQPELWSVNERRNIDLSKLARLKDDRIKFYSLQKGQPAESDLARLKASHWDGPEIIDYTGKLGDFSDTAALVDNLDLVISVDTSTAHLAGALGKPVWILNRYDTCWRWLLDRDDSPWYPTVKLYRQERAGDWDDVLERVKADLKRLSAKPAQLK
jgi:tetratricopeptide (TPR) repeat protein